ncbi:PTS system ascorbate-specific IIA component [Paucibacter oligotrophus]|uniref:PTS system ascorbate-specific IIA component n=1 Tax=Roseateles oligotrophus TaxID=1769250 RepID=A0A840L9X7_9BURK|nr:PTS fructose transporter subunit IIA [Roseateles oligotrophus]MBB4842998.1 PTS system ascorbate-specific IIA component [Roseateles oligotrophus]
MSGLLVIAHAPLASALKAVAEHTFPHCAPQLSVLDVGPEMSVEDIEAAARACLAAAGHAQNLILTDVFGASPHNAALRLVGESVRVVCGVNAPMLWRSLCYAKEPLDVLARRAVDGGIAGIILCGDAPLNPSSES